MFEYRIRRDLDRAVVDGFALPLGFVPAPGRRGRAPIRGYTVDYTPGQDEEPDSYAFYALESHDGLPGLVRRAFALLPGQIHGIVEVGSRDAYRTIDVFLSPDPIRRRDFLRGWEHFEPLLLEDGAIGAGANADEPFVEVFLDQWKGLSIHVPLGMREDVEEIMGACGLEEVDETWPEDGDEMLDDYLLRSVLMEDDERAPLLDELLLHLRQLWQLDLNVDRETNVDDAGRELGATLWHTTVLVEPADGSAGDACASIWATATSLGEMEDLVDDAFERTTEWRIIEIYSIDRVAYDERPGELSDLPPNGNAPGIHLITFET